MRFVQGAPFVIPDTTWKLSSAMVTSEFMSPLSFFAAMTIGTPPGHWWELGGEMLAVIYIYTAVPVCEVRKLDHFVNRTCVRVPKQGFANQYWLVYEAITKWIHSVSEGVIDHRKKLLIITILLHLNNICLREIYITLLEKLLYCVHVYRHFYF